MKCTKEELDAHVRQTYSDPKRDEPLSDMRGLKRPAVPGVSYQLGPIREKEVDEFVRKARAKRAPGGDGVSYKVFKYCDKLRHTLLEMLRALWTGDQCAQQGQVTRWEEHVVERKIGWSDIWEWNTSRLSFLFQYTYDVLPSPVNLVRWKVHEVDKCS